MTGTVQVAVLDDEPVVRDSIARSLTALGFSPVRCATEAELLESITQQIPALLIVDQMLKSERSGQEVVASLREQIPDLPAILVTGFPTAELDSAVAATGNMLLLTKPFSLAQLSEAVNALIA